MPLVLARLPSCQTSTLSCSVIYSYLLKIINLGQPGFPPRNQNQNDPSDFRNEGIDIRLLNPEKVNLVNPYQCHHLFLLPKLFKDRNIQIESEISILLFQEPIRLLSATSKDVEIAKRIVERKEKKKLRWIQDRVCAKHFSFKELLSKQSRDRYFLFLKAEIQKETVNLNNESLNTKLKSL
jgi:hypothetical protein